MTNKYKHVTLYNFSLKIILWTKITDVFKPINEDATPYEIAHALYAFSSLRISLYVVIIVGIIFAIVDIIKDRILFEFTE